MSVPADAVAKIEAMLVDAQHMRRHFSQVNRPVEAAAAAIREKALVQCLLALGRTADFNPRAGG